jgi:hypothetical protein
LNYPKSANKPPDRSGILSWLQFDFTVISNRPATVSYNAETIKDLNRQFIFYPGLAKNWRLS